MRGWLILAAGLSLAGPVHAADVAASAPQALSVTIYRDPNRASGPLRPGALGGFALVTETRTVRLPGGLSRLRFEGVVDGVQPESVIVSGLPEGVMEKNRDGALLSPEALLRASVDGEVTLVRVDRRTGRTQRTLARVRSANGDGVIFQTAEGLEALTCSGLSERFQYARSGEGLNARPTLSVLTRSPKPIETKVTLSYLASGFDWAANYVVRINPDGKTLDLAGWVTLANANAVGLPHAELRVVAGRLRRAKASGSVRQAPPTAIARCWPSGTTSDRPLASRVAMVRPYGFAEEIFVDAMRMAIPAPSGAVEPRLAAAPPVAEALGDLKLYRMPQRTTVAAEETKQVRLLEHADVPFTRMLTADLSAVGSTALSPATALLRTRNTQSDHLGSPLPAGLVAIFAEERGSDLLLGEAPLGDKARDEDIELRVGTSPDVQIRQTELSRSETRLQIEALSPELALAYRRGDIVEEVDVSNALDKAAPFELRLSALGPVRRIKADQPMAMQDGRPIFRLVIPARGRLTVRYSLSD